MFPRLPNIASNKIAQTFELWFGKILPIKNTIYEKPLKVSYPSLIRMAISLCSSLDSKKESLLDTISDIFSSMIVAPEK